MEQEKNSNKDNFKNAICYIPFVAIFLFFTENNKSEELNKHIKYGIFLLIAYVLLSFIIVGLFGLYGLKSLLTLAYLIVSGILGYKVNTGEKVDLEVFDEIEKNVKEKLDENKANNKNNKEL